ncbi:hypothetical protein G647_08736 [Cladophialophora carrionii CBS 160.54]|uniref:Uncharacterized protein n=1 Tax=Cladophialophora carrionii CBS 160.54 TaxID=1279043 RepID=V9D0A6_9EURO|nr:uncharacterized protein G647_08736 [Cladophialophora carrionii CBS 160.54]ETI19723.1 hypothetical protein G647_08736 [Cladophialophora carrionii CBS 160.54]
MADNVKTAIVTGGCSGIGLGLVRHLLSAPDDQQWRVVLADIRPEAYAAISSSLDPSRHMFIHTDVGSWDSQAALFRRAYDYGGGKIDFFAANAGTAEREHITLGNPLHPEDVDGEPTQPNMLCTQVNQIAVFYGLKLFVHYTRRTAKRLKSDSAAAGATSNDNDNDNSNSNSNSGGGTFTPKMVITSSCSALYPFPVAPEYCKSVSSLLKSLLRSNVVVVNPPQYHQVYVGIYYTAQVTAANEALSIRPGATKHAVLALTRSLGPLLHATDGIGLNCIMPAYVATNLTPQEVTDLWPQEWITPIETMLRAYDELTSPTGAVRDDGKSDGANGTVKTGQSVECVVDKLFYRQPVAYADESQRFLIEQAVDMNGVWWQGMRARMESQIKQGRDGGMVYQAGEGA